MGYSYSSGLKIIKKKQRQYKTNVKPTPELQRIKQRGVELLQAQENQTQGADLNYGSQTALGAGKTLLPKCYEMPAKMKTRQTGFELRPPGCLKASRRETGGKGAAIWGPFCPEPAWIEQGRGLAP